MDNSPQQLEFELLMFREFTDYAKKLSVNKNNFENNLAASLIYANLAEYIIDLLIIILEKELRLYLKKKQFILGVNKIWKGKLTMDQKIKILKYFSFPNDSEIIKISQQIKNYRDNIFHNLITATNKNINITSQIKSILTDTNNLQNKFADTIEKIMDFDKSIQE